MDSLQPADSELAHVRFPSTSRVLDLDGFSRVLDGAATVEDDPVAQSSTLQNLPTAKAKRVTYEAMDISGNPTT